MEENIQRQILKNRRDNLPEIIQMISCTFENGHKASLRHVVVDAIIVSNDKILLVRRAAHLLNGGKWAIPGGFLDRDETCEQAILREVKEETGLIGKNVKFLKITDDPRRKNEDRQNVAFIYTMEADGKISFDTKEVSEANWFNIKQLPQEEEFAFDHFGILKEWLKSDRSEKV